MRIKQTIIVLVSMLVMPLAYIGVSSQTVQAKNQCGGVDTAILNCGGSKDATDLEGTGAWQLLIITINILTAGVGVLALAGIVWGAVLYTSAGGNPEQVKKAKTVFTNVVIGVIAFAGMYVLLNFIVPGGVFN